MGPLRFPGHHAAKSLEHGIALGGICQQSRDVRATGAIWRFVEEAVWSSGRARRAVGGRGHGSRSHSGRLGPAMPQSGGVLPTEAMPDFAVLRFSVCC